MARQILEQELTAIESQIAATPQGINISQLETALIAMGLRIHRRTLLRRLDFLIAHKRILAQGVLKGRHYLPAGQAPDLVAKQDPIVPVSDAGNEIRHYVNQPIQRREPVPYHRDFLLAYPEHGPYLDDTTRKHLHQIGRTQHNSLPAGTIARHILGRLLIDLSWASSYLEGNTYSLLETERLLSFGQAAEGKNAQETQMILNHKQAIEFLVEPSEAIGFNRYTILNLHATLSDNLLPDPKSCGRLRQFAVAIGASVYTPLANPQLLEEYFQRVLDTAVHIRDPFEQSFFGLAHLSYLQAFADVNKRVARLTANIPLFKNKICPLSFIDVPQQAYVEAILGVYEMNRIELLRDLYVWGYERSVKHYLAAREELGEPDLFRLEYRKQLTALVRDIVCNARVHEEDYIRTWTAANLTARHRAKFFVLVQQELAALHEGNIARFQIKPAELHAWRNQQ